TSAFCQTATWTGGGATVYWSNSANWNCSLTPCPPNSSNVAVGIGSGASVNLGQSAAVGQSVTVGSLTLDAGGFLTAQPVAYTPAANTVGYTPTPAAGSNSLTVSGALTVGEASPA